MRSYAVADITIERGFEGNGKSINMPNAGEDFVKIQCIKKEKQVILSMMKWEDKA